MNILFHSTGDDGSMLATVRHHLPEHAIQTTDECADRKAITMAIVWLPPTDFFDGLDNLTHVFSLAAGVDQLLTHPGLTDSVAIVRLEDAGMGKLMSEYVLYGVLHAHRKFPTFQRAQREEHWAHALTVPAADDFPVGILGAGTLGSQVASRLAQNGYPVSCWSRTARTLPTGVHNAVGAEGLQALLRGSSVLVCLLPLTEATRGILNASLFAELPAGAFLINVGRGPHLEESDLIPALDSGDLSGALLDVFCEEPLPAGHAFWTDPRIVITPHLAAPSPADASATQVADSIKVVERGERPSGLVDRDRGY